MPERQSQKINWSAITSLISALTAVGALIFTALSLNAARDQVSVAQQGQFADRYSRAIEQLDHQGSDRVQIRLGAIYALERLARDSPRDQSSIIESLSAFVQRSVAHTPNPDIPPYKATCPGVSESVAADVQAALREADLQGANLQEANLVAADLFAANLQETDLTDADLGVADLAGAYFHGARLKKADLSGADLFNSTLDDADLTGANLEGVNLSEAFLSGADLTGANLCGAFLSGTQLDGANLNGVIRNKGTRVEHARTDNTTRGKRW